MNTKLSDLNLHLFEALERLNDDEVMAENGELEVKRAQAITNIAKTVVSSAVVTLNAQKHMDDMGYTLEDAPESLKIGVVK